MTCPLYALRLAARADGWDYRWTRAGGFAISHRWERADTVVWISGPRRAPVWLAGIQHCGDSVVDGGATFGEALYCALQRTPDSAYEDVSALLAAAQRCEP